MALHLLKKLKGACIIEAWPQGLGGSVRARTVNRIPSFVFTELEKADVIVDRITDSDGTDLSESLSNSSRDIPSGSILEIEIPKFPNRAVFRDLEQLLEFSESCFNPPKEFFVWDQAFYYFESLETEDETPPEITNYFSAVRVVQLLRNHCDHLGQLGEIIFLKFHRTQILPKFSKTTLQFSVDFRTFETFLATDSHAEARREVLRSSLWQHLREQGDKSSVDFLLRTFESFLKLLEGNFAIYLSEHTFDKIREEALARKADIVEKLNKLVSSIEAKSLSIPVAVLLASKEMELGGEFTIKNCLIGASSVLFAAIIYGAHKSQVTHLEELVDEAKEAKADLDQKCPNKPELGFERVITRANLLKDRISPTMCVLGFLPALTAVNIAFFDWITEKLSALF